MDLVIEGPRRQGQRLHQPPSIVVNINASVKVILIVYLQRHMYGLRFCLDQLGSERDEELTQHINESVIHSCWNVKR